MKILVFGGAFNPPTIAHIEVANYVRRYLDYDKVIFIPSKDKFQVEGENKEVVFSQEERYRMLRHISIGRPWMEVSDIEITASEQPRTYHTLCQLKNHENELKLLIGSDWLPNLKTTWKYVDEICQEFGIVVMTRNHDDVEALLNNDVYLKERKQYFTIVQTPDLYQDVSSTKVRELLANIRRDITTLKGMIPEELEGLKDYYEE